jgi:hypothetical protein
LRPDIYEEVHCHYIDKAFNADWGNNYCSCAVWAKLNFECESRWYV